MRRAAAVLISIFLAWPVLADSSPAKQAAICASNVRGASSCDVSKHDLKSAKAAFKRAMRLQNERRFEEALDEFETASNLVPKDVEFATARELARQQPAPPD